MKTQKLKIYFESNTYIYSWNEITVQVNGMKCLIVHTINMTANLHVVMKKKSGSKLKSSL